MADQIKRACRSITNNIAEGYGRYHYQENIQYLRQSRGSVNECQDHLYVSLDDEYITKDEFEILFKESQECLRLLNGYIRYLKDR